MNGYGRVWTEEKVKQELFNCMTALQIRRMPTSVELKSLGRNDLHLKISRTRKYSGWAEFLGLDRKESETLSGQNYEKLITDMLIVRGHMVERMSTKHPYDLLVNDAVKVDVKTSNPYWLRGSRVHTFGMSKAYASCDLYICLAIHENQSIERCMIIPSHLCKVVTLCIGKESKYNRFIDRWDYINQYSTFYNGVI